MLELPIESVTASRLRFALLAEAIIGHELRKRATARFRRIRPVILQGAGIADDHDRVGGAILRNAEDSLAFRLLRRITEPCGSSAKAQQASRNQQALGH